MKTFGIYGGSRSDELRQALQESREWLRYGLDADYRSSATYKFILARVLQELEEASLPFPDFIS